MKRAHAPKPPDAGLIADEQRQNILEHFELKEAGGNKFLAPASTFSLFDSMARPGVRFLLSEIFLVILGVYLENKRPKLVTPINRNHPNDLPFGRESKFEIQGKSKNKRIRL